MKAEWTVEKVKKSLPVVDASLAPGLIAKARISGRNCKFATLTVRGLSVEVAWETLANCLNNERPVII